jgi:hypothetical protein
MRQKISIPLVTLLALCLSAPGPAADVPPRETARAGEEEAAASAALVRPPRPIPLPAPADDWRAQIAEWETDPEWTVRTDEDASCFAVARATRSAVETHCLAWNKSSGPAMFQMIRTHNLSDGRGVPEPVVTTTLASGELQIAEITNRYSRRGEDEVHCVLIPDLLATDRSACEAEQVSLAIATRAEDDPWIPPEDHFRRIRCAGMEGRPTQVCVPHAPRSLETETRHPTDRLFVWAWNRSYTEAATAVLFYRSPCDPPWSWGRYRTQRVEPREVALITADADPDDPGGVAIFKLVMLPEQSGLVLIDGPLVDDIVYAASLSYDERFVTCTSNAPDTTPTEVRESLWLRRQEIFRGNIPFVGSFPFVGRIDGELLEIEAPADLLVRYGIPTVLIPKAAADYDTSDCGEPDRVVTLGPGEGTTPDDLRDIFGSATPTLPVTIAACAGTAGRLYAEGFPVWLRYRVR